MIGYREGSKRKRADMMLQIEQCQIEEQARADALSFAFEALKKYEHVAEAAKVLQRKKMGAFRKRSAGRAGSAPQGGRGSLEGPRLPVSSR